MNVLHECPLLPHLPVKNQYFGFVELNQPYVLWNIYTAPEFSFSPKTWCYPIVGCAAYRGYFSEAIALPICRPIKKRGVRWATKYLKQWFWWATHSRLDPIRKFAWMIRRHEENILSYFKLPINNASVEGLNNKIKIISRRAYGFRSVRNHILNLYHCLADLPWPKMMHTFV